MKKKKRASASTSNTLPRPIDTSLRKIPSAFPNPHSGHGFHVSTRTGFSIILSYKKDYVDAITGQPTTHHVVGVRCPLCGSENMHAIAHDSENIRWFMCLSHLDNEDRKTPTPHYIHGERIHSDYLFVGSDGRLQYAPTGIVEIDALVMYYPLSPPNTDAGIITAWHRVEPRLARHLILTSKSSKEPIPKNDNLLYFTLTPPPIGFMKSIPVLSQESTIV